MRILALKRLGLTEKDLVPLSRKEAIKLSQDERIVQLQLESSKQLVSQNVENLQKEIQTIQAEGLSEYEYRALGSPQSLCQLIKEDQSQKIDQTYEMYPSTLEGQIERQRQNFKKFNDRQQLTKSNLQQHLSPLSQTQPRPKSTVDTIATQQLQDLTEARLKRFQTASQRQKQCREYKQMRAQQIEEQLYNNFKKQQELLTKQQEKDSANVVENKEMHDLTTQFIAATKTLALVEIKTNKNEFKQTCDDIDNEYRQKLISTGVGSDKISLKKRNLEIVNEKIRRLCEGKLLTAFEVQQQVKEMQMNDYLARQKRQRDMVEENQLQLKLKFTQKQLHQEARSQQAKQDEKRKNFELQLKIEQQKKRFEYLTEMKRQQLELAHSNRVLKENQEAERLAMSQGFKRTVSQ